MPRDLLERGKALHKATYGSDIQFVASAPGRVNLIGEHTDYNDGFVLPLALELRTFVLASASSKLGFQFITENHSDVHFIALDQMDSHSEPSHWTDYVRGVIQLVSGDRGIIPLDITVVSDVPLGSGLSSSAALEVASALMVEQVLGSESPDLREIAKLCQKAEWDFAKVPCGIMDQFISACGREGHALLLDCRSLEAVHIPMKDPNVCILIVNSNVKHALNDGEYSIRKQQCQEAVRMFQKLNPGIQSLRDADLGLVRQCQDAFEGDPLVFARARHVISETERTQSFSQLISMGDFEKAGKLMLESHKSLKEDYQVSCDELDFLVDALKSHSGVYGARMTGGGFGGSCVALVEVNALERVESEVSALYKERFGIDAVCIRTKAGEGARVEKR